MFLASLTRTRGNSSRMARQMYCGLHMMEHAKMSTMAFASPRPLSYRLPTAFGSIVGYSSLKVTTMLMMTLSNKLVLNVKLLVVGWKGPPMASLAVLLMRD